MCKPKIVSLPKGIMKTKERELAVLTALNNHRISPTEIERIVDAHDDTVNSTIVYFREPIGVHLSANTDFGVFYQIECGEFLEVFHPKQKVVRYEDIVNALKAGKKVVWNDPDPIEGNDYVVTETHRYPGEENTCTVNYNGGLGEAEVFICELEIIEP
jgi:hypothetical protein